MRSKLDGAREFTGESMTFSQRHELTPPDCDTSYHLSRPNTSQQNTAAHQISKTDQQLLLCNEKPKSQLSRN